MTSFTDLYVQKLTNDSIYENYKKHAQNVLRTNVKAYKPKGYLIETNPLSLREAFNSDKRSIKYFCDGIQGKGTDYSIGKINDLSIKLGSLGIAGLIATGKATPLQKGMEFLGLGCWLVAMHLWPKLAINGPIKLFKGVDLNLEYESSAGDRKKFWQDPQFICWDMISDEKMNEIADKSGIPDNIMNRRKMAENKARQVAIQGNTLALLTAGFTTPLLASMSADVLNKYVIYPLGSKYNTLKAERIAKTFSEQLLTDITDYKTDANALNTIEKHVNSVMSVDDISAIQKLFASKGHELKNILDRTLYDLFSLDTEIDVFDVPVTDKLKKGLEKLIVLDEKRDSYPTGEFIKEILQKFNNKIDSSNIRSFVNKFGDLMSDRYQYNASVGTINEIKENVKKFLKKNKSVKLVSPESLKNKLKQLYLMVQIYDDNYVGVFREKFVKAAFMAETSPHNYIWNTMPEELVKILGVKHSDLKNLSGNNFFHQSNVFLTDIFTRITSNQYKYENAIEKFGKFAMKANKVNDRFIVQSLEYLDKMTNIFANVPYHNDLLNCSDAIRSLLRAERVDILTKYLGTDVTLYAPLRALAVLKDLKPKLRELAKRNQNLNVDNLFNAIKTTLFNFQTTGAFINKLDVLKEHIRSNEEYKIVLDTVFSKLPEDTARLLPKQLVDRINDSTILIKGFLLNLSDGVNYDLGPAEEQELQQALKRLNIYQYIDDLFFTDFNDKKSIIKNIMELMKVHPEKRNMLQYIFKFSDNEIKAVMQGNTAPLENSYYFTNALYRTRDMLMLFKTDNLDALKGVKTQRSKMCMASQLLGKNISDMLHDASLKILNHRSWFTKVGVAFGVVAAVTAFSISQFGKSNEFNREKYIERRK